MIRRLIAWLRKGDCEECHAFNPYTMHGNYWHADGCPAARYTRDEGSDDE